MYEIKIFINGNPGYFSYCVDTREQAMDHFGTIVSGGYRRINDRNEFEWYSPSKINFIKIIGDNLYTQYPDKMERT